MFPGLSSGTYEPDSKGKWTLVTFACAVTVHIAYFGDAERAWKPDVVYNKICHSCHPVLKSSSSIGEQSS